MEVVDRPEPGPAEPGLVVGAPRPSGCAGPTSTTSTATWDRLRDDELTARPGARVLGDRRGRRARLPPALAPGQRVAVWPVIACGTCHACRIGRGNACERISLIGIHRDGALQERLAVPATQAFPVAHTDAR